MTAPVLLTIENAIARVTLNRPEVLNAINPAMLTSLLDITAQIARHPDIRVVILTGSGRAFCPGADIKAMHTMDEVIFRGFIQQLSKLSHAWHTLPQPVIAAVHGYALAGGFELALMSDIRIATANTKFGLPDTPLGLPPTSGMTHLLPRIVGLGRAMHLILTGDTIDAAEAHRIGLLTQVVAEADLSTTVDALAHQLASFPARAVALGKQGAYAACDADFSASLQLEEENELTCFRTDATRQQIAAFVQSRTKAK